MKGTSSAKTIEEYLENLPQKTREELQYLHKLIMQKAPKLAPTMEFKMPGYGKYKYKYATGREGEWFTLGFASQKNYISIYACSQLPDGRYLAESFKDSFPKASIGKSCIRVKSVFDLDQEELGRLIAESSKYYKTAK